jgi:hypothetical protein
MQKENSPLLTRKDLRIIGISLSVLSAGFAIAYGGLMLHESRIDSASRLESSATASATLTPQRFQ